MYAGQVVALALTPFLVLGTSIPTMLLIYGVVAVAGSAVFLVFAREHPPRPPLQTATTCGRWYSMASSWPCGNAISS